MARDKFCVGIDIGSSAVKLCQLATGKKGLQLEQYGQVLLPQGTIAEGEIHDSQKIIESIKQLKESVLFCERCNSLSDNKICNICAS